MKRRHVYPPVGKCIYCRSDGLPRQLTLEHIIPESLGGMLELPEASCHDCQAITSAFEGENAGKLFRPIRRQLHLPSKSRGKARREQRENETFVVKFDDVRRNIPVAEYPGLITSFVFTLPTILLGIAPTGESFSGGVSLGILPEFGERLNALRAKYGNKVEFPTRGSAEAVGRLLAKIGHAYAAAEIGLDKFKPYLLGIIRNQDPYLLHHLVGSAAGTSPFADDLHEIEILPPQTFGNDKLIVVKIHLFSNYPGIAVHYVVAGERL
jgi:HNH endonuclease